MNVEIFEALMLVCFGSAWPFAIVKSWRSRSAGGKSPIFLVIIFTGYISGICAHVLREFSPIVFLYGLNASMVFIDLCLVLYFCHTQSQATDFQFNFKGGYDQIKKHGCQKKIAWIHQEPSTIFNGFRWGAEQ